MWERTDSWVVPNNTGREHDSLQFHDSYAFDLLSTRSRERDIAENLNMPLLMPVFPRSNTEWEKYFHSLNSFALRATGSEKRIDLQLIAMIKDAQAYLESETHVQFEDKPLCSHDKRKGK